MLARGLAIETGIKIDQCHTPEAAIQFLTQHKPTITGDQTLQIHIELPYKSRVTVRITPLMHAIIGEYARQRQLTRTETVFVLLQKFFVTEGLHEKYPDLTLPRVNSRADLARILQ